MQPSTNTAVDVAIGDIHGRMDLLEKLLLRVQKRLGDRPYRLVFLGDYIDRGPDSRGVIDRLLHLQRDRPETIFLKGNHEQAMIDFLADPDAMEDWLAWGGEETLASYDVEVEVPLSLHHLQESLALALPDDHFHFLMSLEAMFEAPGYVFVHAGLSPDRLVDDQIEKDLLWIREVFFEEGKDRFPGLTVVHGHTPVKKPENHGWRINVDTGAVWSGKLSAVVLEGDKPQFITT